uniref:Odorant receptor n=1 Tax=Dendrolimus punctatus TaxID=238572 RepID=A0A2K8GKR8_9NEOP|nr:Odorant Receptor 15 [Dendrolimus punctatus]
MTIKSSYDKVLYLTKISLLISGINIYDHKLNYVMSLMINTCLYYFNFVWLYLAIFGEVNWFIHGIRNGESFTELSLVAPCSTISVLGTVKVHYLYYNHDTIVSILKKLKTIHPLLDTNEDVDEDFEKDAAERGIVKESMNYLRRVILLFFFVMFPVLIMFCFSPLSLMVYDFVVLGESPIRYPYTVKYFFNIYETRFWMLIYFHQVWATIIVIANLFASDTLFYGLCAYIGMHFKLLCYRLENIVSVSPEETKQNLLNAIKRHQDLIHLVVTSSLLICLSGFNITVSKDLRIVMAFITFLMLSLAQISLLCVFGDMIMASSTDVSNAAYRCLWYNADQGIKKNVLLIIMRSAKPCKLTAANFADLNLRAFTTILSRSWSYFALLRTMYD